MTKNSSKPMTLTLSEAARTLVAANSQAVLSTLRAEDGYPYGSIVDYLPLDSGDLLFFLSALAEHRRYLQADKRASALIAPAFGSAEGLAEARLTLLGTVEQTSDRASFRDAYLARHPQSEVYIDFADFDFFVLRAERARYIAGFGRMGWLQHSEYRAAAPDLLADLAAGAIQHMNEDHRENLRDFARAFGRLDWAENCRMTGLDRYGFDLSCQGGDQVETVRIEFHEPLLKAAQTRPALVEMAAKARTLLAAEQRQK